MISLYAISKEIDHTQIENVSKQPFWSFLLKEYVNLIQRIRNHKMWINLFKAYPLNFQFNFDALAVLIFGISWSKKVKNQYASKSYCTQFAIFYHHFSIYNKIRIALNILLLPCMVFYLIQMPFKLKHYWLYFFLVFLVFFLIYHALPLLLNDKYEVLSEHKEYRYLMFGLDLVDKKIACFIFIPMRIVGLLLFFKFSYNHWIYFAFGVFIFCVIIYWFWAYIDSKLDDNDVFSLYYEQYKSAYIKNKKNCSLPKKLLIAIL